MAFRLERDESVIAGLKRVARDEMDSAVDHLSGKISGKNNIGRDEAIHEARKSIKKIRALLRLMRAQLEDTYAAENARLRDIAGRLSEFRDAFVILQTFDDLKDRYKEKVRNKFPTVRAGLAKRRDEAGKEENVAVVLDECAATLRKAAKRVKAWPLTTDGFPAVGPGLKATYRAGRKALARARKNPRPENYHELRKRVKDHWYHIRLLEDLWTDVMSGYEKSLKDLETWLGNDHNLVVLREKIAAEPAFYGNQKDIDMVLDLIDTYEKELRDKTLSLADRIYEEKPREFAARMRRLWDTRRSEPKRLAEPSTAA